MGILGASAVLMTLALWPRCLSPGLFENSDGLQRISALGGGLLLLKFTLKVTEKCIRNEEIDSLTGKPTSWENCPQPSVST